MRGLGIALLRQFYEAIQPRKIEAVEHAFSVPLYDPDGGRKLEYALVGKIDLIESDDDGNLIIAELKTSSKRYADSQAENQLDARGAAGNVVMQVAVETLVLGVELEREADDEHVALEGREREEVDEPGEPKRDTRRGARRHTSGDRLTPIVDLAEERRRLRGVHRGRPSAEHARHRPGRRDEIHSRLRQNLG